MINYTFSIENFEYFLLILVRISCFVFTAPLLGQQGIPGRIKIGFALAVSLLLYPVVERPELTYASVVGYAVVVVKEGITGLLIGFAASICNSIVLFAGNIIDMDIGLSMATEFNQDTGTESTLTGNLYYYLVLLLMVSSNLYTYLIRALSDSFTVIPIAHQKFAWDHLLSAFWQYMVDLFQIGFRIFLPFFACIMILNCVLGIMARVAPQMNMFSVGMQLKVLVGLCVIFLTIGMMPSISNIIFREMKVLITTFVDVMT